MIALIRAETTRLVSRRMTRFFPLVLGILMVIGIIIATAVISSEGNGGVDFVDDICLLYTSPSPRD